MGVCFLKGLLRPFGGESSSQPLLGHRRHHGHGELLWKCAPGREVKEIKHS